MLLNYRYADGEWETEVCRDEPGALWTYDDETRETMSLTLPIQPKGTHTFVVRVHGCEERQARQVIAERLGFDEDLGFPYTLEVV